MALKKVTIKDVAREAGVSISTVSNALNDVDVLNPDTKQHILDVAKRLHYIPNINGRNLKAQATNVIGLFVNAIGGPYYSTLAQSIYRGCQQYGYELNVFLSDKADNMMFNILGKRVDGAIILNEFIRQEQVKLLQENEIPTVFIDREAKGPHMSSVIFDSFHEGEQAAYNSIKDFLEIGKPLPDAIFATNDESAIGAMEALLEEGVKVPEQVSIIGCDDIELAQRVRPSMTTIRTSFEKQGVQAVEQLIRLIQEHAVGEIEILYGRIIPRESTSYRE